MRNKIFAALIVLFGATSLHTQSAIPTGLKTSIDQAVTDLLAKTQAPSASIAVVEGGNLVYANAYGIAHAEPERMATPDMRYSIGSISKQFTAAAILLLAEEGKISLDDKLVRWLPDLTQARDVSIRELLSMTSGYQDYWPQDYVMPTMLNPVSSSEIVERWGKIALDFEPGTKWQYSNTNYVIAGLIVEKVAGEPFFSFLQKRILTPLQMKSAMNRDDGALGPDDPQRYLRYAGGPLRVAPKEGRGWLFAAGELAMTASDLAKWDISLIDESLLRPESYRQMETEVRLASGVGSGYGLGVSLALPNARRLVSHGGEVSGFTATNDVFPDERVAVAVLTNMDATTASQQIASKIESIVFAQSEPGMTEALEKMKNIFASLQQGKLDRSLFTANANAYFTDGAITDCAAALGPLGTPQEFTQCAQSLRGGMTLRRYLIKFPAKTLRLTTFIMPDGKIEQYQIAIAE